jgi:subtilisin family serine protease
MPGKLFHLLFLIFWLSGSTFLQPAAPAGGTSWPGKVDPWIEETGWQGDTEFILLLAEQADLSGARTLRTKAEKGEFVYRQLVRTAARTQGQLLDFLASAGVEFRPYWIANMIWVRGDLQLAHSLALRPDIARIYANPQVALDLPLARPPIPLPGMEGEIEWNIRQVGSPLVWRAGYTGQGVVVAGQDTGYEWDHPALKDQYLGWNGSTADHNYAWHDAIHENTGSPCGADSLEPCDDDGHGTHTMGILAGEDSARVNRIGMAPGVRWIGCRNMDQGFGTPATYSECFEWFLAPTDLAGENPDPSRAPDVINNSWVCTPEEGCTSPGILEAVVEAARAAGILVVVSAGNSGPNCRTIEEPPATYEAAFVVGSTDAADGVSDFSSRGPVTLNGDPLLKPDVSAPGEWIRSSYNDGGYTELSGTSMAGPHVAGLAALLISADPNLRGDVYRLERLIEGASKPVRVDEDCGGVSGSAIPNNSAGWGRIDALGAYLELRGGYRSHLPAVYLNDSP